MARGIEGRDIFCDSYDRNVFLSLLSKYLKQSGHLCYAWVLMSNHYHFLFRTSEEPLGVFMRKLNSTYAMYYRKKYRKTGYVFQDRYKSIVTQDQGYIEQLVRYIHLNPFRAGICKNMKELDTYPWCGHSVLLGNHKNTFQNTKDILLRYSKTTSNAVNKYYDYVLTGIKNGEDTDLLKDIRQSNKGKSDKNEYRCWVIGDREFVKRAIENDTSRRINLIEYQKKGITIETVAKDVSHQMGIEYRKIFHRSRSNEISALRKIVAVLSYRRYGIPLIQVANFYGIQSSSVSRMLYDGEELVRKHKIKMIE
ncbi:MAG: transposase [Chitinispirillia bacterium]|jgi:REP element-mobilizing transposase RayT